MEVNTMSNKKSILLISLVAMLFMLMPTVLADNNTVIAFAVFQDNGVGEGTQFTLKGSFTAGSVQTAAGGVLSGNITVYTYASSTSAKVQFCTNTTLSAGETDWSCVGSIDGLTDGTYTFAAVHNETGQSNQSAASNITIISDNTNPTAVMSLLTLSVRKGGQYPVDCSGSTDNTNNTPRVEVNISRDDNTEAIETIYAVRTSAIRTFSGQELSPTGQRIAGCTIYDATRLNTSSTNANLQRSGSTQQNIFISSDGTADLAAIVAGGSTSIGMTTRTKVMIGLVIGGMTLVAIVFGGAMTLGGKKGKRRR